MKTRVPDHPGESISFSSSIAVSDSEAQFSVVGYDRQTKGGNPNPGFDIHLGGIDLAFIKACFSVS